MDRFYSLIQLVNSGSTEVLFLGLSTMATIYRKIPIVNKLIERQYNMKLLGIEACITCTCDSLTYSRSHQFNHVLLPNTPPKSYSTSTHSGFARHIRPLATTPLAAVPFGSLRPGSPYSRSTTLFQTGSTNAPLKCVVSKDVSCDDLYVYPLLDRYLKMERLTKKSQAEKETARTEEEGEVKK